MRAKMQDLARDTDAEGLRYFEFTPTEAEFAWSSYDQKYEAFEGLNLVG